MSKHMTKEHLRGVLLHDWMDPPDPEPPIEDYNLVWLDGSPVSSQDFELWLLSCDPFPFDVWKRKDTEENDE
jgi:hypothetical protein